jgi:hypothetical protein
MAAHILWKWHDMIYVFSRIIWLSSVRDALMTRFNQYDIKHNAFHAAVTNHHDNFRRIIRQSTAEASVPGETGLASHRIPQRSCSLPEAATLAGSTEQSLAHMLMSPTLSHDTQSYVTFHILSHRSLTHRPLHSTRCRVQSPIMACQTSLVSLARDLPSRSWEASSNPWNFRSDWPDLLTKLVKGYITNPATLFDH